MKNGFLFEQLFVCLLNYAYSVVIMFEDDNITLRRGIVMLPMCNKTIVARCDLGSMAFCTPEAKPRVPFSLEGVQNPWTPVTACNNCFVIPL